MALERRKYCKCFSQKASFELAAFCKASHLNEEFWSQDQIYSIR